MVHCARLSALHARIGMFRVGKRVPEAGYLLDSTHFFPQKVPFLPQRGGESFEVEVAAAGSWLAQSGNPDSAIAPPNPNAFLG
jgi:hypothetical protein